MSIARVLVVTTLIAVIPPLAAPLAHAGSIASFDKDEPSTLKLRDGRNVMGRYRNTLGSPRDSAGYAERYEAWRSELGPQLAPALGESLVVVRGSDEPVRGTFQGFAGRTLLLGTSDSCIHRIVPLNKHTVVIPVGDTRVDPDWLAVRGRWKSAPSMYAFTVTSHEGLTLAVPVTMVAERTKLPPTPAQALGGFALGVLVFSTLIVMAGVTAMASMKNNPLI